MLWWQKESSTTKALSLSFSQARIQASALHHPFNSSPKGGPALVGWQKDVPFKPHQEGKPRSGLQHEAISVLT